MSAISVIIPLYNKRPYIGRCLESILSQTVPPAEIIVVDDGSNDGSREVVESYTSPLIRLLVKENGGVSSARNHGIEQATGEFVAFLDADDEWEAGFLETVARLAQRFPQSSVFSTGYRRIYRHTLVEIAALGNGQPEFLIANYFTLAQINSFITSSNTAVRKEIFAQVGLFAEGAKYSEDQEMWVRLALRSPIAYSRQVLATYYCNEGGGLGPKPDRNTLEPPIVVQTLRRIIEAEPVQSVQKKELIGLLNKKIYERFQGVAYLYPGRQSRRFLADNLILSAGTPQYCLLLWAVSWLPAKTFYFLGKIWKSRHLRRVQRFMSRKHFDIVYRQPIG
ncbi:MAG: glycosyltransferase family 2 protein [Desulfuromonadales bacterium]|nr:glycosyltransferase family 2 protein [Desulfuromonadales bacterium]